MKFGRFVIAAALALGLAACSGPANQPQVNKFATYDGPQVTQLLIYKAERRLYLLHGAKVIASYRIELGSHPKGPKHFSGDGRTPEGLYYINRRNPDSRYYLSLGISYPNAKDVAFAKAAGRDPGGDIFIHGDDGKASRRNRDWTAGCVAVSDADIRQIYAMVRDGTPIYIHS